MSTTAPVHPEHSRRALPTRPECPDRPEPVEGRSLCQYLPLIAAAPGGIKKLRELILELAVRGKLVPQDPNDEPASELLGRCKAEKAQLITEKVIKKSKPLPSISEEEKKFALPLGWEWVRIGQVAHPQAGFAFKSQDFNEVGAGLPLIRIRDVGQSISTAYYDGDYRNEFLVEPGDYLISMDGQFRVAAWGGAPSLLNQRVTRLVFFGAECTPAFVAASLQEKLALLQGVKAYTTVDHLSGKQIAEGVIGLPPAVEQHRIVAKVDELMALCDRLETQQENTEAAHATLVKTLLDTLTQSQSTEDFAANWQRLSAHFDTLFTTESSIDALKQTLLQLAVMGKLVPQNPSDEPAGQLLERCQARKIRLIAEKKLKKGKQLPALDEGEVPFPAPLGWLWTQLDEVVAITGGVTLGRRLTGRQIVSRPYLRVANVQRGYLVLDQIKEVVVPEEEVDKYRLQSGDLLVTEGGDWDKVGRTAIWRDEIPSCLHQNHVFRVRKLSDRLDERWAEMYLNSLVAQKYFQDSSKQTTNLASINMTQLRSCAFPLPPPAEQHRLVAKVDKLMALCDRLKAQITASRAVQKRLAIALIEQAAVA